MPTAAQRRSHSPRSARTNQSGSVNLRGDRDTAMYEAIADSTSSSHDGDLVFQEGKKKDMATSRMWLRGTP
jgi:hypothetical protein